MIEIKCDTCICSCKNNLSACDKYDRDCWECVCENRAIYDCGDCEFEPD